MPLPDLRPAPTRSEVAAHLEELRRASGPGGVDLADPTGWDDLIAQPGAVAAVVGRRVAERRIGRPHKFDWPKESGGYRPMAWLDPFDQVLLRIAVGRIAATLQRRPTVIG